MYTGRDVLAPSQCWTAVAERLGSGGGLRGVEAVPPHGTASSNNVEEHVNREGYTFFKAKQGEGRGVLHHLRRVTWPGTSREFGAWLPGDDAGDGVHALRVRVLPGAATWTNACVARREARFGDVFGAICPPTIRVARVSRIEHIGKHVITLTDPCGRPGHRNGQCSSAGGSRQGPARDVLAPSQSYWAAAAERLAQLPHLSLRLTQRAARTVDRNNGLEEAFTMMDATAFTGHVTRATMLAAQVFVKTREGCAGQVLAITFGAEPGGGRCRQLRAHGDTSVLRRTSHGVRGHRKPQCRKRQSASIGATFREGASASESADERSSVAKPAVACSEPDMAS